MTTESVMYALKYSLILHLNRLKFQASHLVGRTPLTVEEL